MYRNAILALALVAAAIAAPTGALAQDGEGAPVSASASISSAGAAASPGIIGFRDAAQLSNPQAWQTNEDGNIRFCHILTQGTNEAGELGWLSEFQLVCTPWQ